MISAGIAIVCAAGALHTPGAAVQPTSRNDDVSAHHRAGLSAQPTEGQSRARESEAGSGADPGQTHQKRLIAKRRAGWLTRRGQRLEEASMRQPLPPWSPAASGALTVVGGWLLVGQWMLVYRSRSRARTRLRRMRVVAGVVLGLVLVSGCGGGGEESASSEPSAGATPEPDASRTQQPESSDTTEAEPEERARREAARKAAVRAAA